MISIDDIETKPKSKSKSKSKPQPTTTKTHSSLHIISNRQTIPIQRRQQQQQKHWNDLKKSNSKSNNNKSINTKHAPSIQPCASRCKTRDASFARTSNKTVPPGSLSRPYRSASSRTSSAILRTSSLLIATCGEKKTKKQKKQRKLLNIKIDH